jgi:hypothetical protein
MATVEDPGKPHLDLCLSEMEAASFAPFMPGVKEQIFDMAIGKFNEHYKKWPHHSDRVRRAAIFTGQLAALCARFSSDGSGPTVVKIEHAEAALRAVKTVCRAGLPVTGEEAVDPRFLWCPDLP